MPPAAPPSNDGTLHSRRTGESMCIYLAGVGSVGSALLRQLETYEGPPSLRLIGACTSQRALWSETDLDTSTVENRLPNAERLDWAQVIGKIKHGGHRPLVFVDATGSPQVSSLYKRLFDAGVHVVTSSKLANTRSQEEFASLETSARTNGVEYHYETAVGAGLPIVQTVRTFRNTGDRVQSLTGAASGTLTYLFSKLRNGTSFSDAVRLAVEKGYAEPDVRDDLSGKDVARKFLILARTAGHPVSRDDVTAQSLLPATVEEADPEDILNHLSTMDAYWQDQSQAAEEKGNVLQYVGQFTNDRGIDVGVQAVPRKSALGNLSGQDNLFDITTNRYEPSSLTVEGPGAGPNVTAAGVLADILKVTHRDEQLQVDVRNRSLTRHEG